MPWSWQCFSIAARIEWTRISGVLKVVNVSKKSRVATCLCRLVTLRGSNAWPEHLIPGLGGELLPVLFGIPHLGVHIKVQREPLEMRRLHVSWIPPVMTSHVMCILTDGKDTAAPRGATRCTGCIIGSACPVCI